MLTLRIFVLVFSICGNFEVIAVRKHYALLMYVLSSVRTFTMSPCFMKRGTCITTPLVVVSAAQNGLYRPVRHGLGHTQQVERGFGLAAHGVNVGQCIRRRDLAEQIGVIRNGREKVHGLHDGERVRNAVDRRVIAFVEPDEQIGVAADGQSIQQSRERARADLGPAARAVCQLGQPDLLFHKSPPFVLAAAGGRPLSY